MNYHIAIEGKAQGPFTLEEVIAIKPSSETLIWKEGETDWKKAILFQELSSLYAPDKSTPPPIPPVDVVSLAQSQLTHREEVKKEKEAPSFYDQYHTTTKPPGFFSTPRAKWIGGIAGALLLWWIAAIVFSGGGSSSSSTSSSSDYSSGTNPEIQYPENYLFASFDWKYRPLFKTIQITGRIENQATSTTYESVRLKIIYKSDSGYELEKFFYTENGLLGAKDSNPFDLEFKASSSVAKVEVYVIDGEPWSGQGMD